MTTFNLSLAHLEHLLALTKKKLSMSLDLEAIEKKIAAVFGGQEPAPASKAPKPGHKPSREKGRRGAVSEKILAALEEAGPEGMSVGEVAARIGGKKGSVTQWIYTAGKKAGVKKVSRGRFTFTGKNADPAPAEPSPAKRGRPPGKTSAVKIPKAPRKGSKKGNPRGGLKAAIMTVLQEAPKDGLSVAEVAEKIGAKKGAVNVWFYTTGKKVAGLKKIAPGRFALKG